MHATPRSPRRPQAKTAVEKRVPRLQPPVDPPLFIEAAVADRQVPRAGGLLDGPGAEQELGPPDMVVGHLEQVGRHQRDNHHRPVPRMLVEIEQGSGLAGRRANRGDRRGGQVEGLLVIQHEDCPLRVRLAPHGEQFVLGVDRPDKAGTGQSLQLGYHPLGLRPAVRRQVRLAHPVRQGEHHVQVLGLGEVPALVQPTVKMGVPGIPPLLRQVGEATQFHPDGLGLVGDLQFAGDREVLLAPLADQSQARVGQDLEPERVGRDGGVLFMRGG